MSNKVKVSIIITIHNAEKYLSECLESAINQTLTDIEILCVDGGSSDSTPEILNRFQQLDSRICIINDQNTSYGHKVNRGIEKATGTYVAVLESDDLYEPNMLETLYNTAEEHQVDFVNANYKNFFDINGFRFYQLVKMYEDHAYGHVIQNPHWARLDLYPRFWTGIFRKDFIEREQIRMNESKGASFQDMSFRFLTAILADSFFHVDEPLYLYRIDNPNSSMHDNKKTVVIADEHDYLKAELRKRDLLDQNIWFSAYQWKYMDFRGNLRNLTGKYRMELFERYLSERIIDREALNSYDLSEFRVETQEMITKEPTELLHQIEMESNYFSEKNKQLYDFLSLVTEVAMNRFIILFGCGKYGQFILNLLKPISHKIIYLTDNSKQIWGTTIHEHLVLSPSDAIASNPDAYYIVAVKNHFEEIYNQLQSNNVLSEHIIRATI